MERLVVKLEDGKYYFRGSADDVMEKLYNYEEKHENGLLIELPCPKDTLVYEPNKYDGVWEIDRRYFKLDDLDKIGKTVFIEECQAKAYISDNY